MQKRRIRSDTWFICLLVQDTLFSPWDVKVFPKIKYIWISKRFPKLHKHLDFHSLWESCIAKAPMSTAPDILPRRSRRWEFNYVRRSSKNTKSLEMMKNVTKVFCPEIFKIILPRRSRLAAGGNSTMCAALRRSSENTDNSKLGSTQQWIQSKLIWWFWWI